MKADRILLGSVLLLAAVSTANHTSAAPRAAEASGAYYLVAAEDMVPLHLGGFYRYQARDTDRGTLTQNKAAFHVGYELLPWFSVYGLLGGTSLDLDPSVGDSSPGAEYGGGVWFNILDHALLTDLTMETRLRVHATGQISHAEPEVNGADVSYTEFYGALTLSLVTEVIGNKNYWPDAIGLFAGPVYDVMESDDFDEDGSAFGIAAGLDMYITRGTCLSFSFEAFDKGNAMNAGLDFRF